MNEIEVEYITKRFGKFTAVDNISLTVKKGEICGFLGPNGAGKTTTIRMLCGLLKPTECKGTVNGLDIMKNFEQIKKRIGYMSQKFSMYGYLTVEENINFWVNCYDVKGRKLKERADYLLNKLSLAELRNTKAGILTGGTRQRCALACALVHTPPIVFLDEPTSGADPIARRDFWKIIRELSSENITVLVTTHYLEEAEYCNNIILISGGKLIAKGTPSQLKASVDGKIVGKKEITLEDFFIYKTESIYNK